MRFSEFDWVVCALMVIGLIALVAIHAFEPALVLVILMVSAIWIARNPRLRM